MNNDTNFPEEEKKKWIEWNLNKLPMLQGKKLVRKKFPLSKDHDHCEFCWAKFGSGSDLDEGYCEEQHNIWICDDCYEIFNEYFHWGKTEIGNI